MGPCGYWSKKEDSETPIGSMSIKAPSSEALCSRSCQWAREFSAEEDSEDAVSDYQQGQVRE